MKIASSRELNSQTQNSASTEVMEQVLNDILKNYSASSYSLILFFARSCMITGRRFEKPVLLARVTFLRWEPDSGTISALHCCNRNEQRLFFDLKEVLITANPALDMYINELWEKIHANYMVWDGIPIANSQERVQGFPLQLSGTVTPNATPCFIFVCLYANALRCEARGIHLFI